METRKITVDIGSFKSEDMSLAVSKDGSELDFKAAFSFYMDEVGMTTSELSKRSGVAERTIRRYKNVNPNIEVKVLVALCVALRLSINRSLHLMNLAGVSLKPSREHSLYFALIGAAYCSDLDISDCNHILEKNGFDLLICT